MKRKHLILALLAIVLVLGAAIGPAMAYFSTYTTARGGIKNRGNRFSGSNVLDNVAWYNSNAEGTTHPVGTKAPNELGIYDMSGNIYEYCQDRIDNDFAYPSEPQVNPTGQETGDSRIIRGGSIDYGDDNCRVARRWGDATYARWKDQGLRLAL